MILLQFEVKTWPNGDDYQGEFQMCLEHGYGRKIYDDVSFQWKNVGFLLKNVDFLLKNVDFIINQGGMYEGEWRNGLHEGEGKMTYENGDYYEGMWSTGEKKGNGKARKTRENGAIFD